MLAVAAAVAFGLALLFDLADISIGEVITLNTLVTLGLLLLALHLAGVASGTRTWSWRRARR